MAKIQKTKNGFTLVELLIYIAIVGIVVGGISTFFVLLVSSRSKNQTVSEVEQQGTQVTELITQTLRNATTINLPAIGTSGSTLSIAVADLSKSPTVFDISGANIRITEGAGQPVVITNTTRLTASNLVFENLSRPGTAGVVRIHFTLTHINASNRNEFEFAQTFWGSGALRWK